MTTEVLSYTISAGATVRAPRGRLFYVKTAASPITITASGRPGAPIKFSNVGAGLKFGPVPEEQHWEYLEITSAAAQTVELIIGDDDVEVAGTVSIAGTVTTNDSPYSTAGTTTDISIAAGTAQTIYGSTTTRRRVTIGFPSTNVGSARLALNATATATLGIEMQPGTIFVIETLIGISVYNPNAAAITVCPILES